MDGSCIKKRRKKKRRQRQKKKKKAMSSYDLDGMDGRGQRTMTRSEQTIGVRARRSGVHAHAHAHAHARRSGTTAHGTKALPRGRRGP
jgi:hypothetical protein